MDPAGTATRPCRRHPRRASLAACTTCAASLCGACINHTPVGFKCESCIGSAPVGARRGRHALVVAGSAIAVVVAIFLVSRLVGGDGATAPGNRTLAAPAAPAERRVHFDGAGGVALAATLGLPAGAASGDGLPGVVILPGFGPTDRDALYPPSAGPDPLYRDLSATLVDSGTVTLRYDKRGTGQSALAPGEQLTFDDLVSDAAAAVGFLSERAEVDRERIALVGHEEGGLVALRLAVSDRRIASVVLVSVAGRPLVEVVADDFRNSGHGDDVEQLEAVVARVVNGEGLPEPGTLPPSLASFFPTDQEEYLRDIFSLDPVAVARGVHVPVLVVRGEKATGISAADAEALVSAIGDDAEVVSVADAGHTLLEIDSSHLPGTTDPDSSAHGSESSGGPPGAGVRERSEEALARIREFLASTLA